MLFLIMNNYCGKHDMLTRAVLTGARFPLTELTAKPVTRQLGPLTRAVNSGIGNRALAGTIKLSFIHIFGTV